MARIRGKRTVEFPFAKALASVEDEGSNEEEDDKESTQVKEAVVADNGAATAQEGGGGQWRSSVSWLSRHVFFNVEVPAASTFCPFPELDDPEAQFALSPAPSPAPSI